MTPRTASGAMSPEQRCLIDSSVWIDFLRKRATRARDLVVELAAQPKMIVTSEPIVMELLAGVSAESLPRLERTLAGFVNLGVDPAIDFRGAAEISRAVRARGHKVRSSMDCLIAAVAVRHKAVLIHKDVDYVRIAEVVPELRAEAIFES